MTQNAVGISSVAGPGNGNLSFASRGFVGPGSVQQLYDGTRLYVGVGTVTFPFDTWSAERIEVLRGPASVLYGEGAIGGIINVVPKKPVFSPSARRGRRSARTAWRGSPSTPAGRSARTWPTGSTSAATGPTAGSSPTATSAISPSRPR